MEYLVLYFRYAQYRNMLYISDFHPQPDQLSVSKFRFVPHMHTGTYHNLSEELYFEMYV